MRMHRVLTLLFLAGIGGCATSPHTTAATSADPGRLPPALTGVPGLVPCEEGASRVLQIDAGRPVTVMVHGRRGSPADFQGLAAALATQGQQTVCFSYDERDTLMRVSGRLAQAVDRLAGTLDTPAITVIGHSKGGLIARKALVADRPDPVRHRNLTLQLVTLSTPFAGIAAARPCASPTIRTLTFGLLDLTCWLISGDSWREIMPASDFILHPGPLQPQVQRHLMIVTDESRGCRQRDHDACLRTDQVFSLAEQQMPALGADPRTRQVRVVAGHVEMLSPPGEAPHRLLTLLQREGLLPTGRPAAAPLYTGPGPTSPGHPPRAGIPALTAAGRADLPPPQ